MKQTILDRAIGAVSPAVGLQRMEARARLALAASLPDPLQPQASTIDPRNTALPSSPGGGGMGGMIRRIWGSLGRDARSDTMGTLPYDRANSRDLARTSPIAVGAINTNIDRVVGTGLALSAQPNLRVLGWTPEQAAEWKAKTQDEFSLWADSTDCDITGTQTFYELQGLVLRAVLESGDAFTALPDAQTADMRPTQPYRLRVQVLEADRVGNPAGQLDTPTISGGIKIKPDGGAPIEVHVYDTHPGGLLPGQTGSMHAGTWVKMIGRTGRRRILHHFRKLRPGQPRGLPYLAPIIDCIKQISRYTEAEIMAAVITSYFTVFVTTPTANASPVFTGEAQVANPLGEVGLGMGAVVPLLPGEEVAIANPLRPNPNFEPFILAVIKQMGMALSIPFELLIKEFNASYSASKAALLDAWVYFRSVRTWLARSFCQPVYETWLAEAVAVGRISAPGFFTDPLMRWAYTRAAWPGDSMGSIDPKKEIEAYIAAVDARFMTREKAEWELFGTDYNDGYQAKLTEHRQLKADDMLPTPKAGAAAPADTKKPDPAAPGGDPTEDDSTDEGNDK